MRSQLVLKLYTNKLTYLLRWLQTSFFTVATSCPGPAENLRADCRLPKVPFLSAPHRLQGRITCQAPKVQCATALLRLTSGAITGLWPQCASSALIAFSRRFKPLSGPYPSLVLKQEASRKPSSAYVAIQASF